MKAAAAMRSLVRSRTAGGAERRSHQLQRARDGAAAPRIAERMGGD